MEILQNDSKEGIRRVGGWVKNYLFNAPQIPLISQHHAVDITLRRDRDPIHGTGMQTRNNIYGREKCDVKLSSLKSIT